MTRTEMSGSSNARPHLHRRRARRRASARWSAPPARSGRRSGPRRRTPRRAGPTRSTVTSRPVPRTRSTSASRSPSPGWGASGRPLRSRSRRHGAGSSRSTPSMRRMSVSAWRPGARDLVHHLGGACGVRGLRRGGGVGQRHHHLDVVRDDVVHLPRDAGPLRRRGQRRLLVPFDLQALGPLGQPVELAAQGAHDDRRPAGRRRRAR